MERPAHHFIRPLVAPVYSVVAAAVDQLGRTIQHLKEVRMSHTLSDEEPIWSILSGAETSRM